ncbi:MAG: hypothetical protein JWM41_3245 [Gemmatimonadetes bacterium]|nr:hypothetical protein [Gemmatimonadota bacterium]
MFNRNALLLVAGAAIFTLDASVASAQAKTPRSTKRIPITKEAPGEVTRVDTVTVYRTDTLRTMGRVDTVTRTQTNTITRVDTVVQSVPMVARHVGGLYFGLGAGPNLPFGAIRTVNEPGVVGQVNLGWQGLNSPLGIRLDGNWTQFADNAEYDLLGPKAEMMGGNLDLKLNIPIFNGFLGSSVRMTPYIIGGGSAVRYRNLRMKLDTDAGVTGGYGPQHTVIAGTSNTSATTASGVTNPDWHDDFGWNIGGGLAFHAGKKEVFVEARGIHFNRDSNRYASSWSIPIIFGVNFF